VASRSTRNGVRLFLDEHISPTVAIELRRMGHDVIAVAERHDLRGRPDLEIFADAAVGGRAVVTFDVIDYLQLVHRSIQLGHRHGGLILLSSAGSWSKGQATGRLVAALAKLMLAHPAVDAFADRVEWLQSADHAGRESRKT